MVFDQLFPVYVQYSVFQDKEGWQLCRHTLEYSAVQSFVKFNFIVKQKKMYEVANITIGNVDTVSQTFIFTIRNVPIHGHKPTCIVMSCQRGNQNKWLQIGA